MFSLRYKEGMQKMCFKGAVRIWGLYTILRGAEEGEKEHLRWNNSFEDKWISAKLNSRYESFVTMPVEMWFGDLQCPVISDEIQ